MPQMSTARILLGLTISLEGCALKLGHREGRQAESRLKPVVSPASAERVNDDGEQARDLEADHDLGVQHPWPACLHESHCWRDHVGL